MKHLKMPSLVAVAALALMAYSATASATDLTSPSGVAYGVGNGVVLTATSTNQLTAGFANVTCMESTIGSSVARAGSAIETAALSVSTLSFTNCGSFVVTVIKKGSIEIHTEGATNNGNGTLTSQGMEFTAALGSTSCTYGTPTATDIGTLTGGTTATFVLNASLAKTAGGFLCANPAVWEGSYKVTNPDTLLVD